MLFGTLYVIKRDGQLGSEYPITKNVVFGSDNSVEIKLKVDDVSERQCQIVPEAASKTLHLEVLDAVHATTVDGQRLNSGERKKLEDGDIVAVGNRRFKIMYPKANHDTKTRTPGRSGASSGAQSAQKKRKSIFDSTPPVLPKTPATPQKGAQLDNVTSTTAFSTETPRTPPQQQKTSPKQPKSILSAKKNILVTRTPTMSPKVVRWGSPKYRSPTSPGVAKPARKSTPAILPRSPVATSRKRSFGTLDEKIKRLAALPARRRSSMGVGIKPETSVVEEVPETPDTSRIVSDDASLVSESPIAESTTSDGSASNRRSSRTPTDNPDSRETEPMKPSPRATPSSMKRTSTSNLSVASSASSSSRKSRGSQSFRVSPITTPKPAAVARLSTKSPRVSSSRSSLSSTSSRKSRQSFRASPSLSGADVLSSTMAASPNVCTGDQPTDSFGSLSVSEADLSMFDGTLMNDGNDHSTLKERRSSGSSTRQRSRVSKSPKAESLMEVDEMEIPQENDSEPVAENSPESTAENECEPVAENESETVAENDSEPVAEGAVGTPDAVENGDKQAETAAMPARRSSRLSTASSSKEVSDASPAVKVVATSSKNPNQENRAPIKKTWAGVLKRSIASGSPFKVGHRRGAKLKSLVKVSTARSLKRKQLQRETEEEIVAAFASTGHALSPQTIFINKKLDAGSVLSKNTPKRNSSLLNKTHDIELEMFVSPFNTPDNSEALERARDFVKKLPSSRKSTSNNLNSPAVPSADESKPSTSRRSTRASAGVVVAAEKPEEEAIESIQQSSEEANGVSCSGSAAEEESGPEPQRSTSRRSTATNLQGVKNLLATPKGIQSPENNLDCDMRGLKKMLATPKAPRSPENDLEKDIGGLKKIFATPNREPVSPKNELDGSFGGVKKLLRTPAAVTSPRNELDGNFSGMKKLLRTPKEPVPPKNELDANFTGVRKLLRTPKEIVSPKNELTGNFSGVKKLLRTPKAVASPKNELDGNFSGVKKLLRTPKDVKSPENNLDCDYRGTKRLFRTPEQPARPVFNDSVLEGVQELLSTPAAKRKSSSPAESKAKRRKAIASTTEDDEHVEVPAPNEKKSVVVDEQEVTARTPSASSRSKRAEKIELPVPEADTEPAESSETKLTKPKTKSKAATSTRAKTTKTRAKKETRSQKNEGIDQAAEEKHSEAAADGENPCEEPDTNTRSTRRKKVKFAEIVEEKTATTRRGRRAKSPHAKTSDGDDSQPSEADSQPSEAESQNSEAELQNDEATTSKRSKRTATRKVEEKSSQDADPDADEVKTPRKGRKPKTAEIVTDGVSETPIQSSNTKQRKTVKPKVAQKSKKPAAQATEDDVETAAEEGTTARKRGRKPAPKVDTKVTEQAVKPAKRTRAVKAAKNQEPEPEVTETAPDNDVGSTEAKPEGKKRKAVQAETPLKKTQPKTRRKIVEDEAASTARSTRSTRARRR